jgi:hypothetical protein
MWHKYREPYNIRKRPLLHNEDKLPACSEQVPENQCLRSNQEYPLHAYFLCLWEDNDMVFHAFPKIDRHECFALGCDC